MELVVEHDTERHWQSVLTDELLGSVQYQIMVLVKLFDIL